MPTMSRLDEFLGFYEVGTPSFLKAVFSEFLATAMLIVMGCGGILTMETGGPVPQFHAAMMFGLTVAMIVWTFNNASGAHINPVVSLSFLIGGQLSLVKFIVFTLAQCAGAIIGSGVLYYILPEGWRGNLCSTVFHPDVSLWQGFFVEVVSTFFLLLAVFACGDPHRTDLAGSVPLTIGFVVFVQSAWAGTLTGCSMNPARTLGPALLSQTWDHHWVYWVAPSVGAAMGTLVYKYILSANPRGPSPVAIEVPVSGSADNKESTENKKIISQSDKVNEERKLNGHVNLSAEVFDDDHLKTNIATDNCVTQNTDM